MDEYLWGVSNWRRGGQSHAGGAGRVTRERGGTIVDLASSSKLSTSEFSLAPKNLSTETFVLARGEVSNSHLANGPLTLKTN